MRCQLSEHLCIRIFYMIEKRLSIFYNDFFLNLSISIFFSFLKAFVWIQVIFIRLLWSVLWTMQFKQKHCGNILLNWNHHYNLVLEIYLVIKKWCIFQWICQQCTHANCRSLCCVKKDTKRFISNISLEKLSKIG